MLDPKNIPVLLTSSVVAHDTNVRLQSFTERVRLALESVTEWLRMNPAQPLVLCDGADFDFTDHVRSMFPSAQIECLHFENDRAKIHRYGRGYGEGEIVRYALGHSELIKEAGCFAKCTSKLWVGNYQECASAWNGRFLCHGVFLDSFTPLRKTRFAYIDTRFYIASVPFYRQYFEDAHFQIRMHEGKAFSLEDCFHEIAVKNKLQGILMPDAPVICGVGGGTGSYYSTPPIRRLKDNLRLRLAAMNPAFRELFA
jgi:hypothetical protein